MKKTIIMFLSCLMLFLIGCSQAEDAAAPATTEQPQEESVAEKKEAASTKVEGEKAPEAVEIKVRAFQFGFDPDPIRVKKGQKVTLKITTSDVTHGFGLPDYNINQRIEPGKTTSVTFTADKSSEFTFFCTVPCGSGHGRMKGKLIVE